MSRIVHCAKLKQDLEGLDRAPFPGELGQKIFESVSKQAWQMWLKQQTMLINEHRLSVIEPDARAFLEQKMLAFLFEDEDSTPQGYVPPK